MTPRGELTSITGCMGSGKSEKLINEIERLSSFYEVAVFRSKKDTRSKEGHVESRTGKIFKCVVVEDPAAVIQKITPGKTIVFFDEAQFFFFKGEENQETTEFIEVLNKILSMGNTVYCSFLNTTYEGKPFSRVGDILAMSDHIHLLKAICMECKKIDSATRSFLSKYARNGEVVVGGLGKLYFAYCNSCWSEKMSADPDGQK